MFRKISKTQSILKISLLVFTLGSSLIGCKDDEDEIIVTVPDNTVTFFASSQLVRENANEEIVKLTLKGPAAVPGIIKVKIASEHTGQINTTPAAENGIVTLAVEKNQTEIQFKVTPVNNSMVDGDKTITLTLLEVSKGFKFGPTIKNDLIIEDDDAPISAHFLLNFGSFRENRSEGLDLVVILSDFPAAERTVSVSFHSDKAIYGTDFVTEPAAVNDKIQMTTIAENDYVFFRVKPIDDDVMAGDLEIRFTIEETADIEAGDPKDMDLTIQDDESFAVYHVEDIRAMYNGENIILGDMIVVGTVTSIDNVQPNTFFIEDETGGIAIRMTYAHNFSRGEQLVLNLGYGLLKESNGVLTVHQVSDAQKVGIGVLAPKVMTLEALHASQEDLEGRMVQLEGALTFSEADGVKTMHGERMLTDGTYTIVVRTLDNASFKNSVVPTGNVTVRGIITEVNGSYILYPQVFTGDIVVEQD